MWENIVQPASPHIRIWRTRVACWITKYKNAHSEYVIINAFLLQEWLRERSSALRLYVRTFPVLLNVRSNQLALTFWRRIYFFNFSTLCI